MNIEITASSHSSSANVLIPFTQEENLNEIILEFAQKYQIPPIQIEFPFKAELKEIVVLYNSTQKIYFLGLGKNPKSKDIIRAFRYFFHQYKSKLSTQLGIEFKHLPIDELSSTINGMMLGSYEIQLYKTEATKEDNFFNTNSTVELLIDESNFSKGKTLLFEGKKIAQTQIEIFNLVNQPSNFKTPKTLLDWALKSGLENQYKVSFLTRNDLEEKGLHAVLAVNQGSNQEPYLIILEYQPQKIIHKVGLVGKGVTFDTGGISLKPSNNMHYMKSDMGGAGAVLGVVQLAAQLQLPIHLIGVIPTVENAIGNMAIKPSDIISSYIGKTIEIIDTDAEGRLILADGIAYLNRNFKPEILIDLATLTGNCIAALGYHAAGLFSNQDELAAQLIQAGDQSGEKLWRLPLWDDYKEDITSDMADLRNFSGKPFAGAISAAKFLEVFTENHPAFAHLDIAGMAFGDSEFATTKTATAFGVKLLITFLKNLSEVV